MTVEKINPRLGVLALFLFAVAALRIPNAAELTPFANFTPIGAMALFGGTYFKQNMQAFLFSLLPLFLSDLVINTVIFHGKYGVMYDGWYWIYIIFILITFLGRWIIKTVNPKNVLIAAISASLCHWFIADFTVWAGGGIDIRTGLPLTPDFAGLQQCYIQGFPFMRNFLIGTLVYSGIMFGIFEWIKKARPAWVAVKLQ